MGDEARTIENSEVHHRVEAGQHGEVVCPLRKSWRLREGSAHQAPWIPLEKLLEAVHESRAVDPHSFYADPDPEPAVFLNADPDPGPGPGPSPA